ncbi:hypothetical protein ACIPSE_02240 [Streptomyces sp. NPDC090106]|uniref:hypothetical protein n=1 Tax=Streptomyces sp. NPDC090106 TaxID=3365946 RepID=UPI0037FD74D3
MTAALLVGITGPAATAVDHETKRERIEAAAKAPVPGADALLAQVKSLGDLGGVLAPVAGLLTAALQADNGQLTPEQATDLGGKVTDAIGKVTSAAPVPVPTTPATPATPTVPATPALPSTPVPLPTLPLPTSKSDDSKAPSADAVGDALGALQKAVTDLLAAATGGDPAKVVPAAQGVLTSLVSAIVAILLGGGLPLPLPVPLPTDALPTDALPTGGLPTDALPVPTDALPVPTGSVPAVGGLLPTS